MNIRYPIYEGVYRILTLLVPPSSPQQMAASIRSLIDNPERLEAFAKASREHIIQDFSVKAYTDGFATLFRSIKKA